MTVLSSRTFKTGEGVSLDKSFALYRFSVSGLLALIFDDTGTAPTGAEWSPVLLDGIFTIEHEQFEEENDDNQTDPKIGTWTIVSGSPDKVRYFITDQETSLRNMLRGRVILRDVIDTDVSIDALTYSLRILDEVETDIIPINKGTVLNILSMTLDDVTIQSLNRAVRRADSKAKSAIGDRIRAWCHSNGWPQNLVDEVEELAALLLRQDVFDDDETIEEKIRNQLGAITSTPISVGDDEEEAAIDDYKAIELTRDK